VRKRARARTTIDELLTYVAVVCAYARCHCFDREVFDRIAEACLEIDEVFSRGQENPQGW